MSAHDLSFDLIDPITGEVLDPGSADQLCAALDRLLPRLVELRAAEQSLRRAIGALALGERRTEHVVGHEWRATVERPATTWDRSTLKRIWEQHEAARRYLRIEAIAPQLREVDQLRRSSGPGVEAFREELLAAERPSEAAPVVKVHRLKAA